LGPIGRAPTEIKWRVELSHEELKRFEVQFTN